MSKAKKKIPTIITDVDDVLFHFLDYLCFLFNSKNGTSVTEADLKSWGFEDTKITDVTGKVIDGSEIRKFFEDYETHGLYSALPPIKNSVMALTLMKRLGYKIVALTARKSCFEKDTEISFITNGVQVDEVIFCANKIKEIKKLAKTHTIVAFADDRYSYIKEVNDTDLVGTCYLINKAHNKNEAEEEGIKRVNDLLEIVRFLPEIKKEIFE